MPKTSDDTICAVATAQGTGGLAVIRISGKSAFSIADSVMKHRRPSYSYAGYTVHRADIVDAGRTVDDVLVSVFHGPRSFTGEDVVEISCHGGSVPVQSTIALLLRNGCRLAGPGEFTQRAYMNGKLDLSQAEAVCDMINAKTDEAYRLALAQKSGALSRAAADVREILLGILAKIEASIDFPEDVGELDILSCNRDLAAANQHLTALLTSADRGIRLRDGAQVVLAGQPNAGKSSLLNALLRIDRAIVTEIPGTTRDTLEESLSIGGVIIRLWDTAGLRNTIDPVEVIGVGRTRSAIETADLVILVIDATVGLTESDREIIEQIEEQRLLLVWNKCDLVQDGGLQVSAATSSGIENLEAEIAQRLTGNRLDETTTPAVLTTTRHKDAIQKALDACQHAQQTIDSDLPADFLSIDVRAALTSLGELTGETANDDVINEIFSKFCIGK